MRLIELFEAKGSANKKVVKAPPPRNFVAKHAKTSGAGSHSDKKYSRKEKHKSQVDENFQSTDDKIAVLKRWSVKNYNNGADTFVEAWDNRDFAELLDDVNGSVEQAIKRLSRLAAIYSEQQADADYYSRGEQ